METDNIITQAINEQAMLEAEMHEVVVSLRMAYTITSTDSWKVWRSSYGHKGNPDKFVLISVGRDTTTFNLFENGIQTDIQATFTDVVPNVTTSHALIKSMLEIVGA